MARLWAWLYVKALRRLHHKLQEFVWIEKIKRAGKPYMTRLHMQSGPRYPDGKKRKGKWYIHFFVRGDEDPDPHDHPWSFRTRVVWGGYVDEIYRVTSYGTVLLDREERARVGRTYERPATHLHRVRLPPGQLAITIVHHGEKEREWGFQTQQGWVKWDEYIKARGDTPRQD